MASELNVPAWQQLIDENITWLLKQPRTLERDHIHSCLVWLNKNKPSSLPPADDWVAEMVEAAYREGWSDGHDEGAKADAHRNRLPSLWEHSRAKAALDAEKGGG